MQSPFVLLRHPSSPRATLRFLCVYSDAAILLRNVNRTVVGVDALKMDGCLGLTSAWQELINVTILRSLKCGIIKYYLTFFLFSYSYFGTTCLHFVIFLKLCTFWDFFFFFKQKRTNQDHLSLSCRWTAARWGERWKTVNQCREIKWKKVKWHTANYGDPYLEVIFS